MKKPASCGLFHFHFWLRPLAGACTRIRGLQDVGEPRPLHQKMKKPAWCGLSHLHFWSCPLAARNLRSSGVEPLREIRDCIRTRLRYRGGMRS
ncbi:hypothetical protein K8353_36995 [Burkholderia contaminans]|nr:hypothetical protein [Burkholderia contaminans]